MPEKSVLIVGAGAAGLAAGEGLAQSGLEVTILEARNRTGGRIHTVPAEGTGLPIELGAEFVHGDKNATWDLIRSASLATTPVSDEHWRVLGGEWEKDSEFWDELTELTEEIELKAPDESFQSLLDGTSDLDEKTKWLAREYVEGFHAADAGRMSVHAFKKAEEAAEEEGGTHQFRMTKGYSDLIGWLLTRLARGNVRLLHNTVVKTIRWDPGHVEVEAETPAGARVYHADCVVVTVPLGVLKQKELVFEPELKEKTEAIDALEMGPVVKVTMQFRSRFWGDNFGFVHSDEKWFPTWWTDERGPVLTCWVGGPRAGSLSKEAAEAVEAEAIHALAGVLKKEARQIKDLLARAYTHNWCGDPFSGGAYSYTPVGMTEMPSRLAMPIAETIYFAGEATDGDGTQGTVHGAVESGKRTAAQILERTNAANRELSEAPK